MSFKKDRLPSSVKDMIGGVRFKEQDPSGADDIGETRDAKIAQSDYMGNSDVTMSSAWKTYRQALRDLPGTLNDTTVLETITWPTEPS